MLSPWLFKAGPFSKVEARFRDAILCPAIKLHQDLKSASHQYEMRYIKVLDRLSPKQMLVEWDLKDADTWQKVRAEKDIGRALYCLHPSIIRLRAEGATPIVVAKPVIVVQSPKRKIFSDSQGRKDSPLNNMTVLPAATEPSPATHHVTSSSKKGGSPKVRFAEKISTFIDNDSSTDSSRRTRPSPHHNTRASTDPFKQKHEDPTSGPPPRRLWVPVDPSARYQQEDRSSGHHSHHHHHRKPYVAEGGKGQPVFGRSPRADPQDVPLPYTRGHYVIRTLYSSQPSQGAAGVRQQPLRKSSRHASGRSIRDMMAQPPSIKASSVPRQSSSALNNSRSFKRFFGWQ